MTRRRDLDQHRRGLGEIREIMNSMKTLAYLEKRKLSRFLGAQNVVIKHLEAVAGDFLKFHPEALPDFDQSVAIYLVIGSERGFCGELNQELIRCLAQDPDGDDNFLVAVGTKLHSLLPAGREWILLRGADVVEDVPAVLGRIVDKLSELQQARGARSVFALYHNGRQGVVCRRLLPPFQHCFEQVPDFRDPPWLYLSPSLFMLELTEQYLFAAMNELLYLSLMAENHNRMAHLEGAVNHLDERLEEIGRQYHRLRQEEIIEEIEVILLNCAYPESVAAARR